MKISVNILIIIFWVLIQYTVSSQDSNPSLSIWEEIYEGRTTTGIFDPWFYPTTDKYYITNDVYMDGIEQTYISGGSEPVFDQNGEVITKREYKPNTHV